MTELQAQEIVAAAISAVTNREWPTHRWDGSRTLRDLGVTSLMLYDFVSGLEEVGGFVFRDNDIDLNNFRTPDSVAALLSSYQLGTRLSQA